MFCVFGAVGINRRRRQMKEKRELEAYWKEHQAEEMLSTTRVSVMEKNAQRAMNSFRRDEE